ncbi:DNA-binding transcriptional regulator, MerR family [Microbulbifer thermotolerans]|uniref:MerR family transcriptional regulator n=1 Tax=Microbulbifer thermotolerans TaxID=252514 RepID=UPI0008E3EA5A|nr:MerR family transcriptional regulator [Microbulbifer thermotolerans]SFC54170.1 DNA-binding transcriptional regulator, MerR family [Microbulbifer thermotolerans]
MRIGELSKRTGISQRMLRYYEQEGLLEPRRTSTGYREYNDRLVALARHIRNLSNSGIKLKSIKILLPCISGEEGYPQFVGCPEVRATLQKELEKLDLKLKELNDSRNLVAGFLQELIPEKAPRKGK